jgi:hypothetical protein
MFFFQSFECSLYNLFSCVNTRIENDTLNEINGSDIKCRIVCGWVFGSPNCTKSSKDLTNSKWNIQSILNKSHSLKVESSSHGKQNVLLHDFVVRLEFHHHIDNRSLRLREVLLHERERCDAWPLLQVSMSLSNKQINKYSHVKHTSQQILEIYWILNWWS